MDSQKYVAPKFIFTFHVNMQLQTDYHLNHKVDQPTGVKNTTTEALEHAEQVFLTKPDTFTKILNSYRLAPSQFEISTSFSMET